MLAIVGIIAAGIVAGLVLFLVIKFTIKALVGLVRKFRNKGAEKVMAADIDSMIAQCTNRKSLSALEELQEQGVTHVVAGVDEDNKVVDNVQLIKNEDEETAYEVVDLLGDEGMVVIED